MQLGPWAQAAARIVGIRPSEGHDWLGKGVRVLRGSHTTDSGQGRIQDEILGGPEHLIIPLSTSKIIEKLHP
jgi:hypothetical protein